MKNGPIIIIPVVIGIVVVLAIVLLNQSPDAIKVDLPDRDVNSTEKNSEIQKKIDDIEKINLEKDYSPKEREWQTSGPFQIDRSKYAIGEKIFLVIGGLNANEKGEVAFMRPLNSTHYSVYLTIPFDGIAKPEFNYYIDPQISKVRGICSVDDITGKWAVVFRGTDYPNLYFEMTKDIVPGTDVEPVC
ncbi:MAG: hypothetical protein HW410_17 [Nitrosarchaeum sp.]|nr:hypothetical protein [Nitrosarchaeum sp.]